MSLAAADGTAATATPAPAPTASAISASSACLALHSAAARQGYPHNDQSPELRYAELPGLARPTMYMPFSRWRFTTHWVEGTARGDAW